MHCGWENDPATAAGYCEGCGRKLRPEGRSSSIRGPGDEGYQAPDVSYRGDERRRPRLAYHDDIDVSKDGDEAERAEKAARKNASATLFVIAALQLICTSIALFAAPELLGGGAMGPAEKAVGLVIILGVTAVFAGLGAWALFMPLPASIIGLVCYLGLLVFDLVAAPEQVGKGLILKIIFIVALAQAINAANKARQLRAARDSRRWGPDDDRW
jgi:hypothetical protein